MKLGTWVQFPLCTPALIAQLVEHTLDKGEVVGSNPTERNLRGEIGITERYGRSVSGSSPDEGIYFCG